MTWTPGTKIYSPVQEMSSFDAKDISQRDLYKFMIGGIVPRPIAFVSTISAQGQLNLAPFSFYNGVSSNPPCVVFSITRNNDDSKKDTLKNIEETKELVINSVAEWMAEPMNHCSANFPHGVSEFEKSGLTPLKSDRVKPPRVKESPLQFECTLEKLVEIGDGTVGSATLVIARILKVHVHKPAFQNGHVILDELKPIARLGGIGYARVTDTFELARPEI